MAYFNKNSAALDYITKSERLCIPFAIVHHATPASKTSSNDLSQVMILSMEGITAAAVAADTAVLSTSLLNFTAPVDANGIFSVLLYNLGTVAKVHKYEVVNPSAGSVAVTPKGASTSGVTAAGNIALSMDWDGNLATTDFSGVLCVDYIISKA